MASAACFPALRARQIDGVKFLDGGYSDNMPTGLAKTMGAEELVCVDLEGVGITRPNLTGLPTTMIRSYWELGDILHFDPDTAKRNMELGYYDTRRAMGYLRGCAYAVSCDAQSCEDAAAFAQKFSQLQRAVREKYPVTLTADVALKLANMTKDDQLAPLEAAARTPGWTPPAFIPPGRWPRRFWRRATKSVWKALPRCSRAAAPPGRRRWPLCCPIHSYRRWCGAL